MRKKFVAMFFRLVDSASRLRQGKNWIVFVEEQLSCTFFQAFLLKILALLTVNQKLEVAWSSQFSCFGCIQNSIIAVSHWLGTLSWEILMKILGLKELEDLWRIFWKTYRESVFGVSMDFWWLRPLDRGKSFLRVSLLKLWNFFHVWLFSRSTILCLDSFACSTI